MSARGYTGVIAGVRFEDGEAVGEGSAADALARVRAYANRKGFVVEDGRLLVPDAERLEPPDPRYIGKDGSGIDVVGTKLRDASVDPRPDDFLPPTHAGEKNPHGPEVVAPGLHAVPPAPIVPGPVSPVPEVQQAIETVTAEAALVEQMPVGEVTTVAAEANDEARIAEYLAEGDEPSDVEEEGPPAKSALVADWRAYAVSQGMDPVEADETTKADLIDRYGD